MARPYTINITNGEGKANVLNGTYSASCVANGYDSSQFTPTSVDVNEGTNSYTFKVAATGTLTIHVTEDGLSTGTPVANAVFYRTDADGNQYGSAVTTDATGNATLNNVPFATSDAPLVYFKQTASDGEHEFVSTVQNTSLETTTKTIEITNTPAVERTFILEDQNYEGLKIGTGSITLT